jgi:hypothetical protein
MYTKQIARKQELIEQLNRRKHVLELQQAQLGVRADPSIGCKLAIGAPFIRGSSGSAAMEQIVSKSRSAGRRGECLVLRALSAYLVKLATQRGNILTYTIAEKGYHRRGRRCFEYADFLVKVCQRMFTSPTTLLTFQTAKCVASGHGRTKRKQGMLLNLVSQVNYFICLTLQRIQFVIQC